MTTILSWNIQNGKGVDGVVSLVRIAEIIKDMADADVICLQEVSRHLRLGPEGSAPDQVAELSHLFPGYETVFGSAVEGGEGRSFDRWQFGNATLTRLPVSSRFNHPLPQPSEPGTRHMPRQAIELTVLAQQGPLRVVNTHLEFHSTNQRIAQVRRLRSIQADICANTQNPPACDPGGPYQRVDRPAECIVCGDFNMDVDSTEYTIMINGGGDAQFQDAWRAADPYRDHEPTCGIFDLLQWPQGAHCRDFFFVTKTIASAVSRVTVNTETDASDHQPLVLEID